MDNRCSVNLSKFGVNFSTSLRWTVVIPYMKFHLIWGTGDGGREVEGPRTRSI